MLRIVLLFISHYCDEHENDSRLPEQILLSKGNNTDSNSSHNFKGTRHAEFVALSEIMSRHHPSILRETDLYVTVEPCIMCASALRQYGIRSVYFGCLNDRFGGTGGVMTVHMDEGVDKPYPVFGGLYREEAIMLLRRFYVQENDKGELTSIAYLLCGSIS